MITPHYGPFLSIDFAKKIRSTTSRMRSSLTLRPWSCSLRALASFHRRHHRFCISTYLRNMKWRQLHGTPPLF
eukprot:1766961-Karenia_brevis.AAC.1